MIEGVINKVENMGDGTVYISFLETIERDHVRRQDYTMNYNEFMSDRFTVGDHVFLKLGRVYKND